MIKPTNFQLRGRYWQVVIEVPKDVRHIFGKQFLRKSTRCTDLNQAQLVGLPWIAEWKQQIAEARMQPDAVLTEIAKAHASVPEGTDPRTGIPHHLVSSTTWLQIERWAEFETIGDAGGLRIERAYIDCDQFGPLLITRTYVDDQLHETVLMPKAYVDEVSKIVQRDKAGLHNKANAEIYVGALTGETGIPFAQFRDEFADQYGKSAKDAKSAVNSASKQFKTLSDVTPGNVQSWVNTDPRARSTIEKNLAVLSSYWKYLQAQQYVRSGPSPFNDITIPKTAAKKVSYTPFEWSELEAIYGLCDDEVREIIDIARYTGMRLEEICLQEQTVTKDGVECFYVDETLAKTGASKRYIPVAKEIAHIPLYKRNSNALGKRFGRAKAKVVGQTREKVFHSIRKNVTTLLEQAGITEGVAADLVGHEKKTMTYGLYSGGSSMEQLQKAMSVIRKGNKAIPVKRA